MSSTSSFSEGKEERFVIGSTGDKDDGVGCCVGVGGTVHRFDSNIEFVLLDVDESSSDQNSSNKHG